MNKFLTMMMTLLFLNMNAFAINTKANIDFFVPLDEIYIPAGFDSNDNVEIIITGYLPNLCYHSPKATLVKQEDNTLIIEVKAFYKPELNDICPEIIVPFTEVANLGILKSGSYEVKVNSSQPTNLARNFKIIDNNSPMQDESIYLYVDYVKKDFTNKTIEIVGLNPSDCFKLDEVKLISNGSNTISVLPILKKTTNFCPMKMTPMSIEVLIPNLAQNQKVLLHVRSMEGKSYNTIFMNIE